MYLQISKHFDFVLFVVFALVTVTTQFDIQEETEKEVKDDNDVNDVPNVDDSESLLSNVVSDVNKTLTNLYNTVTLANVTAENTNNTVNETRKLIRCKEIVYDTNEEVEPTVEIVNASQLIKLLHVNPEITSRDMEADYLLVFFYARACPFSAKAAPHFNALARAFPDVKMVALDALKYGGTNTVYGIVGVPTLKVFHNGRPYGKFNGTEYNIQSSSKFLNAVTGKHAQSQVVMSKDFQGPVSSVVEVETDYFLVLSWLFIIVCSVYYFMQSKCWTMIVEMVQNIWRESEAHTNIMISLLCILF